MTLRMGCNGGGFINAWSNEVLWVFFFENITKKPIFHGFLKDIVFHELYSQYWFSCHWVPGGASDYFFL